MGAWKHRAGLLHYWYCCIVSCLSVWIVNKCASAIIEFYVCVFLIISYFQSRKWACVWNNVWLLLSLYHCLEFINMIMKCRSVVLSIAHQDLNVNIQPLKEELNSDHVWSRFMPFLPFWVYIFALFPVISALFVSSLKRDTYWSSYALNLT